MRTRTTAVALFVAAVASAPAASAANQSEVLPAVADVSIMRWSPNENFGADPRLEIKHAASIPQQSFDRKIYLRFDVSGVDLSQLLEASLRLTVDQGEGVPVEGPQDFSLYALPASSTSTWDEFTITWMNAPFNDVLSGSGVTGLAQRVAGFSLDGGGKPGSVVRASDDGLADFLRDFDGSAVDFVIVRDTFDPNWDGFWHAFASFEAGKSIAPSLELVFDEGFSNGECVADVDASGVVDFADLIAVMTAWGSCSGCAEDVDENGDVAFADLMLVLSNWGLCP